MPLQNGKSPETFAHNVKAELKAGKPRAQSLAIAYALKRRAAQKKAQMYAEGGEVQLHSTSLDEDTEKARRSLGVSSATPSESSVESPAVAEPDSLSAVMAKAKKASHYASGGLVDAILEDRWPHTEDDEAESVMADASEAAGPAGEEAEPLLPAFQEKNDFNNTHSMDDSEHGNIPATEDDSLVGQILRARRKR